MNKITLYKEALIKYIKKTENREYGNTKEISIGILFLIIMNRYCKIHNINGHGYFLSHSFIKNYVNLIQNNNYDILLFIRTLTENMNYIIERNKEDIGHKIKSNFYYIVQIVLEEEKILYNKSLFEKVTSFMYILLITAEYITTGDYYNPNMKKLGEYFAYFLINNNQKQHDYDLYNILLKESLINLSLYSDSVKLFIQEFFYQ